MTITQTRTAPTNPATSQPTDPQPESDVQRFQYAIQLPNGQWWRKLSLRLSAPAGTEPSIFHNRARAEEELYDVIGMARTVFGVRTSDYQPRLMVRTLQISPRGATFGPWLPVSALIDEATKVVLR
ncbi:hypothetical protein [Nocardia amamiensis]|uniref:hypothetical protein n=1 Tax=Nocardia amamiensis TaxID=404578 RepID=UPI0008296A40|nr:hypothetical protein [Nocardia amamiensis]